jgi:hypothetical protein
MLYVSIFPTFLELLNADDKKIIHIFFRLHQQKNILHDLLFKHLYANTRRRCNEKLNVRLLNL